jgi:quinol monooxygenase YgiN
MYLNMVRIYPDPAHQESLMRFLLGRLGPTRVQPGCLSCTLASESEPEALLYMETWESRETLLSHLRSAEFGKILEAMESSARKPDFLVYESIDREGIELLQQAHLEA